MLDVAELNFGPAVPVVPTAFCDRLGAVSLSRSERKRAKAVAAIVAGLPESGSIVIVHSPTVVDAWRGLIHEARGVAIAAVTRVLSAPAPRDEAALSVGLNVPVFRDPFVDQARAHRRALVHAARL